MEMVEMEDGGKQEQTYIKDSKFCLKKITANPDNVKREGRDKDKPELNKKQRWWSTKPKTDSLKRLKK